jgi:hypothetical protein
MEFGIDFDAASKAWRSNKKHRGKGYFLYICNYIHSNGKRCRRTIYSNILYNPYKSTFNNDEYYDKYACHPNIDVFCKRHLNRYIDRTV